MARQYLILIADNGVIFPNNRNECQIAWVGFNGHLFRPTGGPYVLRRLHDDLLRHAISTTYSAPRPTRRGWARLGEAGRGWAGLGWAGLGWAGLAEVFRKAGFTHFRRAKETSFNLILEARR